MSSVSEKVSNVGSDERASAGGGRGGSDTVVSVFVLGARGGAKAAAAPTPPPPPKRKWVVPSVKPKLAATRIEYRGESLVWALAYLSSGVCRKPHRWAWLVLGGDIPPRGSVLLGTLQSRVPRPLGQGGTASAEHRSPLGVGWKYGAHSSHPLKPICL